MFTTNWSNIIYYGCCLLSYLFIKSQHLSWKKKKKGTKSSTYYLVSHIFWNIKTFFVSTTIPYVHFKMILEISLNFWKMYNGTQSSRVPRLEHWIYYIILLIYLYSMLKSLAINRYMASRLDMYTRKWLGRNTRIWHSKWLTYLTYILYVDTYLRVTCCS